jgi:hypothetical protein
LLWFLLKLKGCNITHTVIHDCDIACWLSLWMTNLSLTGTYCQVMKQWWTHTLHTSVKKDTVTDILTLDTDKMEKVDDRIWYITQMQPIAKQQTAGGQVWFLCLIIYMLQYIAIRMLWNLKIIMRSVFLVMNLFFRWLFLRNIISEFCLK